jgi:hypothetical protein
MMEMQRQSGRVELANLDFGFRAELQQRGFNHDFDLSALSHEQRQEIERLSHEYALEQIDHRGSIDSFLQMQALEFGLDTTFLNGISNIIASIGMSDMDPAGQQAAIANAIRALVESRNLTFPDYPVGGTPPGGT